MTAVMTRPAARMTRPAARPAGDRGRLSAEQPHRCRSSALELGAYPDAVPSARLHTRAILDEWELGELAGDAAQIVSELVANSVEAHKRERLDAPVRLTLLAGLRTLLIAVRDASGSPPVPGDPSDADETGRGLLIVEALSAHWNWKAAPGGGKVVRALIRGQGHA